MSRLYDSNAITIYGPIVSSLLHKHYPKIEEVADNLGISVRTFQRRLERDGLSYSQLVERIRLERACNLLKRGELKLSTVACSLGYSDPSSFSRAFKRWKGVRPSAYRRQCTGQRRGKV